MYLTTSTRREYGLGWTRGRDRKGNLCWRSDKRVNLSIVLERYRIGTPVPSWGHGWCVYEGRSPRFTTQLLRRAFQFAGRHARILMPPVAVEFFPRGYASGGMNLRRTAHTVSRSDILISEGLDDQERSGRRGQEAETAAVRAADRRAYAARAPRGLPAQQRLSVRSLGHVGHW